MLFEGPPEGNSLDLVCDVVCSGPCVGSAVRSCVTRVNVSSDPYSVDLRISSPGSDNWTHMSSCVLGVSVLVDIFEGSV